jgi:hypothetical protein
VSAKADGSAEAQRFEAVLDLTPASIVMPRAMAKPGGVPLRLELRGKAQGDGVEVENLSLHVADWRLGAQGTARNLTSAAPVLSFTAEAQAPGLNGLLRLLPPVAAGLGPRAKTDGQLAIKARLSGTPANLHAEADVKLARLAVKVPDARLGGGGAITLVADVREHALDGKLQADFTALDVYYLDVIRKNAGVPLSLDAAASQAGAVQKLRFALRAADLKADGHAEITPAGKEQALAADVSVPPFRTGSLTAMLPGLSDSPIADMRAGAQVHVRGRLGVPASMQITVEDLSLAAGKSDLRGRVAVSNLLKPRIDMEARSAYLDVDDFVLPTPAKTPPKKKDNGALANVGGRVRLDVARGRAAGIDYQDLRTDLSLEAGRAVAKTMEVGVFGGHFSGAGSELNLLDDRQPFSAKGALTKIDVDAVITHFVGVPGLLGGRLDSKVELAGAGTMPTLLEKTLEGFLEGGVQQPRLLGGSFLEALLGPVVAKVNGAPGVGALLDLANPAWKRLGDRAANEMRTGLQIAKGAINLRQPVTFDTASGPVRLDGRVLIGGSWDLAGVLTLSPEAATALSAQRLKIDRPVPVKLAITGPLARPRVAPTALDEVARVFAVAFAHSALKGTAAKGAQDVLDRTGLGQRLPPAGAPASVDDARAKAEAMAAEAKTRSEAEAAEARRRLEEEKARAEAAARARAEEAKRNAAEKAKEKLRGVFGQ